MVIGECSFDKSRMRTFKEAVDLSDDCVTASSYSDPHAGRVKAQANERVHVPNYGLDCVIRRRALISIRTSGPSCSKPN